MCERDLLGANFYVILITDNPHQKLSINWKPGSNTMAQSNYKILRTGKLATFWASWDASINLSQQIF